MPDGVPRASGATAWEERCPLGHTCVQPRPERNTVYCDQCQHHYQRAFDARQRFVPTPAIGTAGAVDSADLLAGALAHLLGDDHRERFTADYLFDEVPIQLRGVERDVLRSWDDTAYAGRFPLTVVHDPADGDTLWEVTRGGV